MKTKSKLVIQSIAIRDKAKAVIFWSKKEISKVKNALLQWILQTILGSLTFRRIAKFIMVDFYEMDFMKGIVILVTVDEMYNILKSLSHCLLIKRWRWNWMIKVFARVRPSMSIRLLHPSFIKGQPSCCEGYSWEFDIAI